MSLHTKSPSGDPSSPGSRHFHRSRRRHFRHTLGAEIPGLKINWDFFDSGSGKHQGELRNISLSGCLLQLNSPLEFGQRIRIALTAGSPGLSFTLIGRIVRAQSQESPYTCGIEFIFPVNTLMLGSLLKHSALCPRCGGPGASVNAEGPEGNPESVDCPSCHLGMACHNLICQEFPEREE